MTAKPPPPISDTEKKKFSSEECAVLPTPQNKTHSASYLCHSPRPHNFILSATLTPKQSHRLGQEYIFPSFISQMWHEHLQKNILKLVQ